MANIVRLPSVHNIDLEQVRAETPGLQKVVHFNSAGISVQLEACTQVCCRCVKRNLLALQELPCQLNKCYKHNNSTLS